MQTDGDEDDDDDDDDDDESDDDIPVAYANETIIMLLSTRLVIWFFSRNYSMLQL